MRDLGIEDTAVSVLVLLPVYLMGVLAAVDVIRRGDLGRIPKTAWVAAILVATPVTLIYLLARPVGRVGTPDSERLGPDDPRVRFTEAVEHGDLTAARRLLPGRPRATPTSSDV